MSPGREARRLRRLMALAAALGGAAGQIALARRGGPRTVHFLSRRLLRVLGVRRRLVGPRPPAGLLVCNHLGYLDILVLASITPTRFVAKGEVAAWPVFGWFARRSGTIFVERGRPASVAAAARAITAALEAGERVVLFPEGTSSGGVTVLPFRSPLLEPARRRGVTPAAVSYALAPGEGDAAEVVCYWKDMSLVPHLLRLLGCRRIQAALALSGPFAPSPDRKELAARLRQAVIDLKEQAEAALPSGAAAEQEGAAPVMA